MRGEIWFILQDETEDNGVGYGLVRQSLSRPRAGMTYFKKNEDEYELITSASRVQRCEATRGEFETCLKSPRVDIAHGKTRRVAPELLPNFTSYSRVSRVTPEFHEFPTQEQLGACLTTPLLM